MIASIRSLSEIKTWHANDDVDVLLEEFFSKGLVFLDGIKTEKALLHALSPLGSVFRHRDSLENGLTHVTTSGNDLASASRTGKLGFTQAGLIPHTDRSGAPHPPNMLAFWIENQATISGTSLFVDGLTLFEKMSLHFPSQLAALCRPNSAIFKSENGYVESSIFSTDNDRLSIRFRFDQMIFLSPDAAKAVEVLLPLIRESSLTKKLTAKQGYILDNTRWLHGRTHFVGARSAYRLLLAVTTKEKDVAINL